MIEGFFRCDACKKYRSHRKMEETDNGEPVCGSCADDRFLNELSVGIARAIFSIPGCEGNPVPAPGVNAIRIRPGEKDNFLDLCGLLVELLDGMSSSTSLEAAKSFVEGLSLQAASCFEDQKDKTGDEPVVIVASRDLRKNVGVLLLAFNWIRYRFPDARRHYLESLPAGEDAAKVGKKLDLALTRLGKFVDTGEM
jgi:hypothetical protein